MWWALTIHIHAGNLCSVLGGKSHVCTERGELTRKLQTPAPLALSSGVPRDLPWAQGWELEGPRSEEQEGVGEQLHASREPPCPALGGGACLAVTLRAVVSALALPLSP